MYRKITKQQAQKQFDRGEFVFIIGSERKPNDAVIPCPIVKTKWGFGLAKHVRMYEEQNRCICSYYIKVQ